MFKKAIGLAVLLAMLMAIPAVSAANPEYPVLTQTFESTDDQGKWHSWGTPTGQASFTGGELKLTSTAPYSDFASYYGRQVCKDFTAEFEFRTPEGAENDAASFIYRADKDTNGYQIFFVRCPDTVPRYFIKFAERPYNELKSGMFFPDWTEPNLDYATDSVRVKVVVSGGVHQFYMARSGEAFGDTPIMSYDETTEGDGQIKYDRHGYMGFLQWHDGGERTVSTYYDNLTVTCNDEAEQAIPPEDPDTSEVVEGTVTQDFSAPLSDKWGFYRADANGGSIEIVDGMLRIVTKSVSVAGESAAYYKDKFQNGTIDVDVVLSLGNSASVVFRGQDYMRNGYQLIFDKYTGLSLCKRPYEVLATAAGFELEYDKVYHAKITVDGKHISAVVTWLDDEEVEQSVSLSFTDEADSYPDAGYVGFVNFTDPLCLTDAFYDNLVITKVVEEETSGDTSSETGGDSDSSDTSSDTSDSPPTKDSSAGVIFLLIFAAVSLSAVAAVRFKKAEG
mgnify:CR=1 FL=1